MNTKDEGLIRSIGVGGLTANIVNIVIGAGIFALPAIVASDMGRTGIVAYLFCGFLIALVMLCFAEVGSKVAESGGGYSYIEIAFGKYAGFVSGFLYLLATFTADAAVSNALLSVLGAVFPVFLDPYIRVLALFIIFFGLAGINILGVKQGMKAVKLLTFAKLTPLLLLVLVGWKDVSVANLLWDGAPSLSQLGATSLILFFAFQGAEIGLSVGGEIKNPQRTVPRAILFSIVIILVFYILIQTVSQGVLGSDLATFKANPLAEVGRVIFGPIGYTLLFIGAAVSMFGMMSGEILNNPRLVFALGRDRVVPIKMLTNIHKVFKTPYVAIIVYVTVGFIFAVFGGFNELAIISTAAVLILYFGVALSVLKLRRMKNTETSGFTIPGGPIVPILTAILSLYFLSHMGTDEMIGTALFCVALTVIYWLMKIVKKKKKKKK